MKAHICRKKGITLEIISMWVNIKGYFFLVYSKYILLTKAGVEKVQFAGQIQPTAYFANKFFYRTHSFPVLYISSMAASVLQ